MGRKIKQQILYRNEGIITIILLEAHFNQKQHQNESNPTSLFAFRIQVVPNTTQMNAVCPSQLFCDILRGKKNFFFLLSLDSFEEGNIFKSENNKSINQHYYLKNERKREWAGTWPAPVHTLVSFWRYIINICQMNNQALLASGSSVAPQKFSIRDLGRPIESTHHRQTRAGDQPTPHPQSHGGEKPGEALLFSVQEGVRH